MQLTDKKLKQLIKESVVEALQENEVYKLFISECIKNTFELISEHLILGKTQIKESPEEKVRNVIKNKNQKMEIPDKEDIINEDIAAARRMLEDEFFGKNKNKIVENNSNESFDDEEDIKELLGLNKKRR